MNYIDLYRVSAILWNGIPSIIKIRTSDWPRKSGGFQNIKDKITPWDV
jgi:hypothetical protein